MWSLSKMTKNSEKMSRNEIVSNITQMLHNSNAMKFEKA